MLKQIQGLRKKQFVNNSKKMLIIFCKTLTNENMTYSTSCLRVGLAHLHFSREERPMMPRRNRVVVTGMGILRPTASASKPFGKSLLEGRSGIGPITLFDASELESRIAGEVKDFDPSEYIEPEQKPKRMARHTQARICRSNDGNSRCRIRNQWAGLSSPTPVVVGVSTSALDIIERVYRDSDEHGLKGVAPTAYRHPNHKRRPT